MTDQFQRAISAAADQKALAAERATAAKLRAALTEIRDHFIPFDRAPRMATQNHYLKDIARKALAETEAAPVAVPVALEKEGE